MTKRQPTPRPPRRLRAAPAAQILFWLVLWGVGSPIRPSPPDRPEKFENHRKSNKIIKNEQNIPKTIKTVGKRPTTPSPVRPSLRAGQFLPGRTLSRGTAARQRLSLSHIVAASVQATRGGRFKRQKQTLGFLIHDFWAGRKSSIFGVWAAPAAPKTMPKCGGLRPPYF